MAITLARLKKVKMTILLAEDGFKAYINVETGDSSDHDGQSQATEQDNEDTADVLDAERVCLVEQSIDLCFLKLL